MKVMVAVIILLALLDFASTRVYIDGKKGTDNKECLNGSHYCKSLEYVSNATTGNCDNLEISIISFNLNLTKVANFTKCNSLNISGNGTKNTTIQCGKDSGLLFKNSSQIYLTNLSISDCAFEKRYREQTADSGCAFMHRYSREAVGMYDCHNIKIYNVMIRGSDGVALQIENVSNITIHRALFIDNYIHRPSCLRGGGINIYNSNATVNGYSWVQPYTYISIINCSFISNSAYNIHDVYKNVSKSGGGLYIFLNHQYDLKILVSDCIFVNNTASTGGALFIHIGRQSKFNQITVVNSNFSENSAPIFEGGALNIVFGYKYSMQPGHNVFTFRGCQFINNAAHIGGAVAMLIPRARINYSMKFYDKISFKSNIFSKNRASASAAIDINRYPLRTSHDIYRIRIEFQNCSFTNNIVIANKTNSIDRGIVFSAGVPITFGSTNWFENNYGTALCIAGTTIIFWPKSFAYFINNTGDHGGAILLIEKSTLNVNHSSLSFYNNTAYLGGAICVIPTHTDILFETGECVFYRYSKGNTSNYNERISNFAFKGNNALSGIGHDIFVSSLTSCAKLFKCRQNYTDLFLKRFLGTFNFSLPFDDSVATAPHKIQLKGGAEKIYPFPGLPFQINILQVDELNKTFSSYFFLSARIKDKKRSPVTFYSDNETYFVILYGRPNNNITLVIQTTDFSNVYLEIKATLQKCPPGYILVGNTCSCGIGHYQGISYCAHNESAAIMSGQWAGFINNEKFATGCCSPYLCSFPHSRQSYGQHFLPLNESLLTDYVCHDHRTGTLCSECEKDYTVYYHSPTYTCGKTSKCQFGALFYILSEIIPVTGIFLFITILNINLTSGALYSFIFYSQILNNMFASVYPIVPYENTLGIILKLFKIIYGVFNFDILELNSISYCLVPDANVMDMLMFKYLTTFYAFCLILMAVLVLHFNSLYTCIKLCHKFGRRNVHQSVINGLTAFLILCYFRCLVITFHILFPVSLMGVGNKVIKSVPLYGGELTFMKGDHLKYAVPAIFILVLFILPPPVLLIAEPLLIKLSGRFRLRRNKLTSFLQKARLNLKPFLDSFQGCFKDNCRCFAGLFFLYRIAMVPGKLIHDLAWDGSINVVILFLIILLHSVCSPFQKRQHNNLDMFLLVNILLVNFGAVLEYFLYIRVPGLNDDHIVFTIIITIQVILITIPLVYIIAYASARFMLGKRVRGSSSDYSSFPDRLNQNDNNYGSIQ